MLGLTVEIDERLAEYDRDLAWYVPIEQIAAENPEELERLANGQLPSGVDEAAFRAEDRPPGSTSTTRRSRRLLLSRSGKLAMAAVNGTGHVWDLLPRNMRW